MTHSRAISRRRFLQLLAALGAGAGLGPAAARAPSVQILTRPIPSTGEPIPLIGMGSWITFHANSAAERAQRVEVLRAFFQRGGGLVDSSPMYGLSEEVIGHCLERLQDTDGLFSATKVWTPLTGSGPGQMETSRELWGLRRFDLMQIHNLLGWQGHLQTLRQMKADGRLRYIGITTSHGRRHREFEQVMADPAVDTVQFTYNILDREAERRLLPAAAEMGRAVIINRPFRRKALIQRFQRHPLPSWAGEIDCANWPQFLLKT